MDAEMCEMCIYTHIYKCKCTFYVMKTRTQSISALNAVRFVCAMLWLHTNMAFSIYYYTLMPYRCIRMAPHIWRLCMYARVVYMLWIWWIRERPSEIVCAVCVQKVSDEEGAVPKFQTPILLSIKHRIGSKRTIHRARALYRHSHIFNWFGPP